MRLNLRLRVVLAITTVVLSATAVATVAHLSDLARVTLQTAADEGRLLAMQLFHQSASAVKSSQQPSLLAIRTDPGVRELLRGIVGYSHTVVYAAVVDTAGYTIVHDTPEMEGKLLPSRESIETVLAQRPWRLARAVFGAPEVYEAQVALKLGEEPFGMVRVGISSSLLRNELSTGLMRALVLIAGALITAGAVGVGVASVLLRSLRRISQGMERLARGEYESAVDLTRDDELGELAARVNRLGERIQADRLQWQSEKAKLEGTLNSLEDGVILLNAKREVLLCNPAAERMLEKKAAELVGQPLAASLPDTHPMVSLVAELFEMNQECSKVSISILGADGRTTEFAVSCYRTQDVEKERGGILLLQDMESIRAVQSLVAYSQKLAALGRLTSGVAHEVKTPLNAMRIHLELLKIKVGNEGPAVAETLNVIAREIERLDRVVQGFLKFARPQDLRVEQVDINGVLTKVTQLTRPEAAQAGVEIVLALEQNLPPIVGDSELLEQACTNLTVNAIQAMPQGGTATLSTRARPSGQIEVRVSDQGIGIPQEDLDKIFKLYYTTKPDGSGIGLSLVYRIIQMHDGQIEVESEAGRGTTMILTLPQAPWPSFA